MLGPTFPCLDSPRGPSPPHFWGFEITPRHTTLVRTPLDGWSARCTDLYHKTHNNERRQISMPSAGSETAIQASQRPQTHALERAATGIGFTNITSEKFPDLLWGWFSLRLLWSSSGNVMSIHLSGIKTMRSKSYLVFHPRHCSD